MTESGIGSLLLCGVAEEKTLKPALAWLKQHFSVSANLKSAYQEGRLIYHLYALERVGTLLGSTDLLEHDWYQEGAGILLANQGADGSWDDGSGTPVPNTALALLFLTRATQSIR